MKRLVTFRSLEERDLGFIYRFKNDKSLSKLSINGYREFSYEESIEWLDKCIHDDGTYKYWAICTNDEFQNIIGWCSVSRIDFDKKEAYIHGVTVADAKYKDGSAFFASGIYMADYIFHDMGFDKVYTECLSGQNNTKAFLNLILGKCDFVNERAVSRNGLFYDILTYSMVREEYERQTSDGLLNFEVCMEKLKELFRKNYAMNDVSISIFMERFKSILTETNPSNVTSQTRFMDLKEWSSLFAIEMAALVEEVCKVRLDAHDLQECESLEDLYNCALTKK